MRMAAGSLASPFTPLAEDIPPTTTKRQLAKWLSVSDERCILTSSEDRLLVGRVLDHAVGEVRLGPLGEAAEVRSIDWSSVYGGQNR